MEELIKLYPFIETILIYGASIIGGLTILATAVIGFGKAFVKATFWTEKDDEILVYFEYNCDRILNGPLKPIFKFLDRFSIFDDTIMD